MVGFAARGGVERVRYLGLNLQPHLARAARLDLPTELRERVDHLRAQLDGFDDDTVEGRGRRLADLYAGLARINLLAGLPIPDGLRPVPRSRSATSRRPLRPPGRPTKRASNDPSRSTRGPTPTKTKTKTTKTTTDRWSSPATSATPWSTCCRTSVRASPPPV